MKLNMRPEHVTIVVSLLLTIACGAHIQSKRRQPVTQIMTKLDKITQYLGDLKTAITDLDTELREALTVDPSAVHRIAKRSAGDKDNTVLCGLGLADFCQTIDIMRESHNPTYLNTPGSPGKRTVPNYRKIVDDFNRKRNVLQSLNQIISKAGRIMEREKKWMTCHLNMGGTCQTEEVSNIADIYDFVNSAHSPGKKRSVPMADGGNKV